MTHYDISANITSLGSIGWSDVKNFFFDLDTTEGKETIDLTKWKDEYISVIVNEQNIVIRLRGNNGLDARVLVYNMDYVLGWDVVINEDGLK